MKKIAIMAAAILFGTACPLIPAQSALVYAADTEEEEDAKNEFFSYKVYSEHVKITNILKSGGDIVIPAEIDGLPVTDWDPDASIPGFYAFSLTVDENNPNFEIVNDALICKTSKVLILYAGKSNGYSAANEIWLENYQVPDDVLVIGKSAFRNAKFIHSMKLPESLTALKTGSLQGTSLEEITIPESVTEIADAALNTNKLKTITLAGENPAYQLIDGVLFTKDGKTLCCYPQEKEGESYSVPEGTAEFMKDCFINCRHVNEIKIPASFTGSLRPTEYIHNLKAFDISPDNTLYSAIGGVAFNRKGDTLMKYPEMLYASDVYYVPDGTTTIDEYAFYGAKFYGVVFPESVTMLSRTSMFGTEYRNLKFIKVLNPKCVIKANGLEFGLGVDPNGSDVRLGIVYGYKDSTAQTFAKGNEYCFTALSERPGDLNTDGVYNLADIEMLRDYLLSKPSEIPFNLKAADMNADGILNAADLSLLKKYVMEIPRCVLTYKAGDQESHQITVAEGDMLYEQNSGLLTRNASPLDAYYGRTIQINSIKDGVVSYTTYSRNYHTMNASAEYGKAFKKDSLLKGFRDIDYTFSLQFDAE